MTSELHEITFIRDTVRCNITQRTWHDVICENRPLRQIYFQQMEHRLEIFSGSSDISSDAAVVKCIES